MKIQEIINAARAEVRKLRTTITNGSHPETVNTHFHEIEALFQSIEHPGEPVDKLNVGQAVEILNVRKYENLKWERGTVAVVGTLDPGGKAEELTEFAAIAVAEKLERENEPVVAAPVPESVPVVVEAAPVEPVPMPEPAPVATEAAQ